MLSYKTIDLIISETASIELFAVIHESGFYMVAATYFVLQWKLGLKFVSLSSIYWVITIKWPFKPENVGGFRSVNGDELKKAQYCEAPQVVMQKYFYY